MAQVDYFLKVDGISGESKDKVHAGEIDVVSFSFGASNATTIGSQGGGSGSGKVSFQDFHITKHVDRSSADLLFACASGKHIKDATLTCRKAGGVEFLKVKLSDVFVTSYTAASNLTDTAISQLAGDDMTFDAFTLAFAKIEVTYTPQSGDQSGGGWDVVGNSGA
jgi:type VI secretion system secreted protein Hcp